MAVHKYALLRYRVLDKCFRNKWKRYTFDDLLDAVNEAILEENPKSNGIKIRQLREDIRFMKDHNIGFSAPIETFKVGKHFFYYYEDPKFSISNMPLKDAESAHLKAAIQVLQRFEGAPQFEWLNSVNNILQDKFGIKNEEKKVIGFEQNIDYTGSQHISTLFNAINNKQALEITYQPFDKDCFVFDFHPYYLKQYNNRWFVFGRNEANGVPTWNVPLDRIEHIDFSSIKYIEDETDWEEYFYDIVGVTRPNGHETQEVVLLFEPATAQFVITKPLHASQKQNFLENGQLRVRLKVIPNFELEALILSFGENAQVLEPENFKQKITQRIFAMQAKIQDFG